MDLSLTSCQLHCWALKPADFFIVMRAFFLRYLFILGLFVE
jgi:hypothetical protein